MSSVCSNHQRSAATISALQPVRTPEGEKCCMWSTGLCASWEGVSLRVVLGVFHTPAWRTRQNLVFQPLANTRSLAMMLDRLVGCGLMKGRVIHLCYHTQKSLSGVSGLIKGELILWYCLLLFCANWEGYTLKSVRIVKVLSSEKNFPFLFLWYSAKQSKTEIWIFSCVPSPLPSNDLKFIG